MHQKSIELLNEALADELYAVHQYMFFHFHLEDQGLGHLSEMFRDIAQDEFEHMSVLAERILTLGGNVKMAPKAEVEEITDVLEMLKKARSMEENAIKAYNEAVKITSENSDAASRHIFVDLVLDEEGDRNTFDMEIRNIEKYGPSYLALQALDYSRKQVSES